MDFWIADTLTLPFRPRMFGRAVAIKVADCVTDPATLVREVKQTPRPGGQFAVAMPF